VVDAMATTVTYTLSLHDALPIYDAKLIIAHVVDTRSFATIEVYDANIYERAEEEGKKLLADYEQQAKEANVSEIKTVLKYGSPRSEEHTSELQSRFDLVCRLLLE